MTTNIARDYRNYDVLLFLLPPHWLKTPPLSLIYLENFLSSKAIRVKIIDLNILFFRLLNSSQKEWLQLNTDFESSIFNKIKDHQPRILDEIIVNIIDSNAKIIGFSVFGRNHKATMDAASFLLEQKISKTFVFGGPEILFEYCRDKFFEEFQYPDSYFVLGEGELPLLYLAQNKQEKFNLHKDRRLIAYEEIDNLDNLDFINFDCLDLKSHDSKVIPLLSSRGCIKRCCFCSEYKLYSKFRQHSASYMAEQILFLQEKYKINTFSFQDSLINANLKWLDDFCTGIIKKNMEIKWEAQLAIRPEMDIRLFLKMKKSGCYNLFVGLESASDNTLLRMQKGYNRQDAKNFLRKLADANLQFEISLIAGFPQETEKDFKETISFIKENKSIIPKIAQLNPFVCYEPSQINREIERGASLERVRILTKLFKQEKIRFTPAYINNLTTDENKPN